MSDKPADMSAELSPWPPAFHVEHGPGHLVVHWRWRSRRSFFWLTTSLTVLAVMLGSFAYELPPLLPTDSPQMRPAGILIICCLLYAALAALINHSEVSVKQGVLEVRHRPLPWWPRRVVDCSEIKQLFCREHINFSENGMVVDEYHSVHLELSGGSQLRLVGGLWKPEQAAWIEDTIEALLGIEDHAVAGERFKARGLSKYR